MSKTFRAWSLDQALLLPPSVHDFVPAGHLSRFVVAGALGLVWAIGAYSVVVGILLVGLSLRLKRHRHA